MSLFRAYHVSVLGISVHLDLHVSVSCISVNAGFWQTCFVHIMSLFWANQSIQALADNDCSTFESISGLDKESLKSIGLTLGEIARIRTWLTSHPPAKATMDDSQKPLMEGQLGSSMSGATSTPSSTSGRTISSPSSMTGRTISSPSFGLEHLADRALIDPDHEVSGPSNQQMLENPAEESIKSDSSKSTRAERLIQDHPYITVQPLVENNCGWRCMQWARCLIAVGACLAPAWQVFGCVCPMGGLEEMSPKKVCQVATGLTIGCCIYCYFPIKLGTAKLTFSTEPDISSSAQSVIAIKNKEEKPALSCRVPVWKGYIRCCGRKNQGYIRCCGRKNQDDTENNYGFKYFEVEGTNASPIMEAKWIDVVRKEEKKKLSCCLKVMGVICCPCITVQLVVSYAIKYLVCYPLCCSSYYLCCCWHSCWHEDEKEQEKKDIPPGFEEKRVLALTDVQANGVKIIAECGEGCGPTSSSERQARKLCKWGTVEVGKGYNQDVKLMTPGKWMLSQACAQEDCETFLPVPGKQNEIFMPSKSPIQMVREAASDVCGELAGDVMEGINLDTLTDIAGAQDVWDSLKEQNDKLKDLKEMRDEAGNVRKEAMVGRQLAKDKDTIAGKYCNYGKPIKIKLVDSSPEARAYAILLATQRAMTRDFINPFA
eukprot:g23863.t1